MSVFIQTKCPKCGYEGTAFITKTATRKVVFDSCYKCGAKTTNEEEEDLIKEENYD